MLRLSKVEDFSVYLIEPVQPLLQKQRTVVSLGIFFRVFDTWIASISDLSDIVSLSASIKKKGAANTRKI